MSRERDRRRVVPEILDTLAPADPEARASRRDLRRINAMMFSARVAAGLVRNHIPAPPGHVVDLGCGDGAGARGVARRLGPAGTGARWTLLDRQPDVEEATIRSLHDLGWTVDVVAADACDWLAAPRDPADLILANLFLHHFDDDALSRLMSLIAGRTQFLVATEPVRSRAAFLAARSVRLIGANAVTRHDAPVSVRAGFGGRELSTIWPGTVAFEGRRGPFIHAFAAAGTPA